MAATCCRRSEHDIRPDLQVDARGTAFSDPQPLEPTSFRPLEPWLARELGAGHIEIAGAALLAGGAVQQNWRLDVVVTGGSHAGRHAWVLRTDAAASLAVSLDRLSEYHCIEAAHRAGVRVAAPVAASADESLIGRPFAIQALVAGNAQGRRIVRDPNLAGFGDTLAATLGRQLAPIHRIRPGPGILPVLALPMANPSRARRGPDAAGAG